MQNTLKLLLSISLLLCLIDFPYGYYQFVRFFATLVFIYLAYNLKEKNKKIEIFIYISLALLFQPFIKIALGRTLWNIVDVIVALALLMGIQTPASNHKNES